MFQKLRLGFEDRFPVSFMGTALLRFLGAAFFWAFLFNFLSIMLISDTWVDRPYRDFYYWWGLSAVVNSGLAPLVPFTRRKYIPSTKWYVFHGLAFIAGWGMLYTYYAGALPQWLAF